MIGCPYCEHESPAAHHDRVVYNKTALHGDWAGWRMAGKYLVAPGKAGRIVPARVLAMLWAEQAARTRVKRAEQPQRRNFPEHCGPTAQIVRFPDVGRFATVPPRELFAGQA